MLHEGLPEPADLTRDEEYRWDSMAAERIPEGMIIGYPGE